MFVRARKEMQGFIAKHIMVMGNLNVMKTHNYFVLDWKHSLLLVDITNKKGSPIGKT